MTTLSPPARTRVDVAVRAEGLVKRFGDNVAVDHVDLEIERGIVYGVLGPNGAGKTTTLSMLATLLTIDEGRAEIFGVDVQREPHMIRQLVGVTGQYASVDEGLTGSENLWLFARLQGLSASAARARAADLLERFGLTDAANRRAKQYSGGMRRRLDLAASLIMSPPLIFLDEPTTGLDPRTRGQMWDTIRDLVAGGCTVLLTTQYLDEADQLADRIAVIDHGVVIADGTADELKQSVGSTTLQLTPADRADAPRVLEIVDRFLGGAALSPEAARVTAGLNRSDVVPDILIALRENNIEIDEINVQKPTLDEVFLTITGKSATADDETKEVA